MDEIERLQFKLMIPADLKEQLENAAHANRRSLSAEMIARLQRTMNEEKFVKSTQSDTGSEDYLARLTSERIKFEALLSQYVNIFQGYTPADITRLFEDYEELRRSVESKSMKDIAKGNDQNYTQIPADNQKPKTAESNSKKAD